MPGLPSLARLTHVAKCRCGPAPIPVRPSQRLPFAAQRPPAWARRSRSSLHGRPAMHSRADALCEPAPPPDRASVICAARLSRVLSLSGARCVVAGFEKEKNRKMLAARRYDVQGSGQVDEAPDEAKPPAPTSPLTTPCSAPSAPISGRRSDTPSSMPRRINDEQCNCAPYADESARCSVLRTAPIRASSEPDRVPPRIRPPTPPPRNGRPRPSPCSCSSGSAPAQRVRPYSVYLETSLLEEESSANPARRIPAAGCYCMPSAPSWLTRDGSIREIAPL